MKKEEFHVSSVIEHFLIIRKLYEIISIHFTILKRLTEETSTSLLLDWITTSYSSFLIVENPEFIKFLSSVSPLYNLPGADTVSNLLWHKMEEKEVLLIKYLQESQSRINLLVDVWESPNSKSFIGLYFIFVYQ